MGARKTWSLIEPKEVNNFIEPLKVLLGLWYYLLTFSFNALFRISF